MERDRFHEITAVSAAGMEEAKRDVQEAIDADAATQDLGNRSALPPVGNGDVSYEEAVEAAERHQ